MQIFKLPDFNDAVEIAASISPIKRNNFSILSLSLDIEVKKLLNIKYSMLNRIFIFSKINQKANKNSLLTFFSKAINSVLNLIDLFFL